MTEAPFFVGWAGAPHPRLGRFLALVAAATVAGFGVLGWGLGATGGDPAAAMTGLAGAPRIPPEIPSPGRYEGVLERGPAPLLRLDPTPSRPQGRTLMMTLYDKRGVAVPEALYGRRVATDGVLFARGDLSMLVGGGAFETLDDAPPAPATPAEPLGRWRLSGEICDGKCYAGVMRPGDGLSHRACAALCFIGDVPAVFVAAAPVAGSRFLILAGPDGGPPPPEARALFGVPVTLEGAVERRGDALIFRADLAGARLR